MTENTIIVETELGTEAVQTEVVTEKETEPVTENLSSIKDIQISIPASGRKGSFDYQIFADGAEESGAGSFSDSRDAFMGEKEGSCFVFSDKSSTIALDSEGWHEGMSKYLDIWGIVYSAESQLAEDTEINGTSCYHIQSESDDEPGGLIGLCNAHGFRNVINGTCKYDFYIAKDTFSILRLDVSMSFMGEKDGNSEKGDLTASFTTTELTEQALERPDVEVEAEPDDTGYTAGTIDGNLYTNEIFGIRISGKNLFSFNAEKTNELSGNYESMGSRYSEEAYGEGDGVIVNISSIPSGSDTKENIMAKYLQDSSASNIQAAPVITVGNNEYAASTADINGTMTKTYCSEKEGRVLIITVYYSDLSSPETFESGMFGPDDDPNWTPEDYTLAGKYTVTTPDGYSIVKEDSGEIFVCFRDSSHEVNMFAIEDTTVENEIQSEVASTDTISKSVQNQSDITLDDGSVMTYLEIYNVENETSYYTYIGLLQKDTAVIKTYVVSTATADFTGIFHDFASRVVLNSNTGIQESETQVS